MARVRVANQFLWGLAVFSLSLVLLVVLSLYLDLRQQHASLKAENVRLTESQVLLMVPQEQATALKNWLASHPEQTQHLVEHAVKQKEASKRVGPLPQFISPADETSLLQTSNLGSLNSATQPLPPQAENSEPVAETPSEQQFPVVVSETGRGVKVIALPNGGIRVTTRENEHQ